MTGDLNSKIRVIDADSHVMEREEIWEKYMEDEYRPKRPRMVQCHDQCDWFFIVDTSLAPPPFSFKGRHPFGVGGLGPIGLKDRQEEAEREKLQGALVGGFDPHARIKDMDLEGRDVDVLYPSLLLGENMNTFKDYKLISAICRAYNNWLADFCRPYPDRLKAVASVCLYDVDEAVKEVNRCVSRLGFVGVMIAPAYVGTRDLDNPEFYPFYEECQRLGIPVSLHIALQENPPKLERINHRDFALTFALVSIPHLIALGQLIFGGVLDRFPKLRFAFLESGVGWVPYMMERFDSKYKGNWFLGEEAKTLPRMPSEYVKSEQLFFSCDSDEETLPYVVELIGEDRILYASDYPHNDATFPNSVRNILNNHKLSESAKIKILQENPTRLYGLEKTAVKASGV